MKKVIKNQYRMIFSSNLNCSASDKTQKEPANLKMKDTDKLAHWGPKNNKKSTDCGYEFIDEEIYD